MNAKAKIGISIPIKIEDYEEYLRLNKTKKTSHYEIYKAGLAKFSCQKSSL